MLISKGFMQIIIYVNIKRISANDYLCKSLGLRFIDVDIQIVNLNNSILII